MSEVTREQYAAAIPKWCSLDMEAHERMVLCWSLANILERGEKCPESNCIGCDAYKGEKSCV